MQAEVANGLERQSPLAAISVGMFARIARDFHRAGNRWRDGTVLANGWRNALKKLQKSPPRAALDMKAVRAKPGIFRDRREAGRLQHDLELFKVRDFAPDFAQLLRQRFD